MGSATSKKQSELVSTDDDREEKEEANGDIDSENCDVKNHLDVTNQETRANTPFVNSNTHNALSNNDSLKRHVADQIFHNRTRSFSDGIIQTQAISGAETTKNEHIDFGHTETMRTPDRVKSSPKGTNTKPEQDVTVGENSRVRNEANSKTRQLSTLRRQSLNHLTTFSAEEARKVPKSQYKSTQFSTESNYKKATTSISKYSSQRIKSTGVENGTLRSDDKDRISNGSESNDLFTYTPKREKMVYNTASKEIAGKVHFTDNTLRYVSSEIPHIIDHTDKHDMLHGDIEAASSLGSTTLEYTLPSREESDVTIFDYFPISSTDSFTETRLRMKFGLLEWYGSWGFDVPKFPLLSEHNSTYLQPWMTRRKPVENVDDLNDMEIMNDTDKDNYIVEKRITSFKEILDKRNVFLTGDHGTGKSMFLRYIIKCWVDVHTEKETDQLRNGSNEAIASDLETNERNTSYSITNGASQSTQYTPSVEPVNSNSERCKELHRDCVEMIGKSIKDKIEVLGDLDELLKYDFVFFISLKHDKEQTDIYKLIEKQYKPLTKYLGLENETHEEIITLILDTEHEKCLVLVDDLDDWRPIHRQYKSHIKTSGLPDYDHQKMYTILWTLTPLKLKQLNYQMRFPDLVVNFKGIDAETAKHLSYLVSLTVDRDEHQKHKPIKAEGFYRVIHESCLSKFERFPYTFQTILYVYHETEELCLRNVFNQLLDKQFTFFQNSRKRLSGSTKWHSHSKSVKQSKRYNTIALPSVFDNMASLQANKELLALFCKNAYFSWIQSLRSLNIKQSDSGITSPEVIDIFINVGLVDSDNPSKHFNFNSDRMLRLSDNNVQSFLAATYVTMQCLDTAYQNMGNVKEHSRKINEVVDSLVDVTRNIGDIFSHSEFIIFLCGLCPPIAHRFIKDVNKVVNETNTVHQYRHTFVKDVATEHMLKDIQEFSLICLRESLIENEGVRELQVSDIFSDIKIVKYQRYLVPEMIKSMHIYFSQVDDYDSLSKFIYDGHQYVNLQKLVIEDKTLKMTRADVGLITTLLHKCSQSLAALSCNLSTKSPETYRELFETFHTQISSMIHLSALEMSDITLTHGNFSSLTAVVSRKLRLKQLRLVRIFCNVPKCEGEDHVIYLTDYNNLEFLEIEGREITIADVNASSLTKCQISNVSPTTEMGIFESLRRSNCIQSLTHKSSYNRPSLASKQLIKTLKTCDRLQRLDLIGTNISSNELKLDEIRSLTRLKLCNVQMAIDTWIGFINSLFLLPNHVKVYTKDLNVTPNDADVSLDELNRPIQSETRAVIMTDGAAIEMAIDYVKIWSNEIRILLELPSILNFETVKPCL